MASSAFAGKVFLDSNILIYALVSRQGASIDRRAAVAEQKLSEGGSISVQVLNEFCDVLSRKFGLSWMAIDERLEVIATFCGPAIPLTAETQKSAVGISVRYGFRIYDSMILAAAAEGGCGTVYTEDMQQGQVIQGVRIENPFV
jgi:predicted nucleic acid-binding protein